MKLYQRVAQVVASEGFAGVWRRIFVRLFLAKRAPLPQSSFDAAKVAAEYEQLKSDFRQKIASVDFPGIERFMWYHTIDLGDGFITPGNYDYREVIDSFGFPDDMSGMQVLDIGSATGFFSFEFEKRGATVTSVELPSVADWDMPRGVDSETTLGELMKEHDVGTTEELQYHHLDGPFLFCQKMLGTHVERCYSTIYDICPEKMRGQEFDLVFVGDVLLHLFSPLKALSSVASVCKGKLIISQTIPETDESRPSMVYIGGESRQGDCRAWWYPNKTCFTQMLKRVGFSTVEFYGEKDVTQRSSSLCSYNTRTIIHATK